jgi:adenine-specific DNA-methyltransferase
MSKNISKEKRTELLSKIAKLEAFLSNANATPEMRSYLADLKTELKRQKYGLVFEEHKEEIDEILETHTPVLTEIKDRFIDNGGQMNFLIEGDNLSALKLLEKTHKGKIDVIYIDPPYNTGNNDFIYNDKFVAKDDLFKHSKWLSFMKERISLTPKLLSQKGVCISHIDENELGNYILLFQSIYGENNVDYIVWQKTDAQVDRNTNSKIIHRHKSIHEYVIIAYKDKNITRFSKMYRLPDWKNAQKNTDDDERGAWSSGIMSYEEGHRKEDKNSPYYYAITTPSGKVYKRHWFVLKEEFDKLQKDNRISFPKNGDGVPRLKTFELEEKEYYMDSILRGFGTSSTAKDELGNILNDRELFDTPKPVKLSKEIIRSTSFDKSTILDFFAGSGTVGQAILELNKEIERSNRKFILCQHQDGNDICSNITYERIKTVITGKRKDDSKYSDGLGGSLKYQKIEYLLTGEQIYYDYADELLKHIRELVELENAINFDGNKDIAIILTENEAEKFFNDKTKYSKIKAVYLGHDISLNLEQQKIVSNNNITVNVIPEYYYEEKLV